MEKRKVTNLPKRLYDVWYEGSLVLGTSHMYNYGLAENMVREDSGSKTAVPPFIMHAPELYQNRTIGIVERVIPYVDQMQQIHIKLQQLIAKARPAGIFLDIDGIAEIDMGDGNFLSPLEIIKIYDETGNVIGSSSTAEGGL